MFGRMLRIQRYAVWALVLREMQSLRGDSKWGYLRAVNKPLLMLACFTLMRVFIKRQYTIEAFNPMMMVPGFMLFFQFRQTMQRNQGKYNVHGGIFMFPVVRPLDVIAARAFVNWYLYLMLMVAILALAVLFGAPIDLSNWEYLVAGTVGMGLFSVSGTLAMRNLVLNFPFLATINMLVMRLMFWISGVFFSTSSLPQGMLAYFRWNPISVCLEMTRYGLGVTTPEAMLRPAYTGLCIIGLFALGGLLERYAWRAERS